MTNRYIGNGPYCYANCLAMILADGTDPGLIEVITGSPFGLFLLAGRRPLFNPVGWDPGIGVDAALELLGWSGKRGDGGDGDEALARLRAAVASGPVLVGPMDMGLLTHHADASGMPIGADHYVLVFELDNGIVRFHDPHGHAHATLPAEVFAAAWRGDSIGYARTEYSMRYEFTRVRRVDPLDALQACLPAAIAWLNRRPGHEPPGTLGGGEAAFALAELIDAGPDDGQVADLKWFGIPVGTRRLSDAAYWLSRIGLTEAAAITDCQARLMGSLQYPVATGDMALAAKLLRALAPTYRQLSHALEAAC
jgi:hypothetical protein